MTNQNLTSTKFIFSTIALALTFILVVLGKLAAGEFINFVNILGGTYILGNVASKFADKNSAD
jgi:hypothetical protein